MRADVAEEHHYNIIVQIAASTFALSAVTAALSGHPGRGLLLAPGAQVEQLLRHYG